MQTELLNTISAEGPASSSPTPLFEALLGLLTGAVASIVLVALDHVLAALVVAVVTVAVVVTLLIFARRGIRHAADALRGETRSRRPQGPPRVR